MSEAYQKRLERTREVLSAERISALGKTGRAALRDAVMIMAFADGDVDDAEARFLEDLNGIMQADTEVSDDLIDDAIVGRAAELGLDAATAKAFLQVLLIVSELDDNVDSDELGLWHKVGEALKVDAESRAALLKG